MKSSRIAIILLVMSIMVGVVAGSMMVSAEETVEAYEVKDIRTDTSNGTDNSTTIESMFEGLFSRIIGIFGDIIDFFVMVITAPFRAWANIWSGWGTNFATWWGPLLATIVLVGVYFIYKMTRAVDRRLLSGDKK